MIRRVFRQMQRVRTAPLRQRRKGIDTEQGVVLASKATQLQRQIETESGRQVAHSQHQPINATPQRRLGYLHQMGGIATRLIVQDQHQHAWGQSQLGLLVQERTTPSSGLDAEA